MDYVNEYLRKHKSFNVINLPSGRRSFRNIAPKMKLADGTSLSVQVSHTHYCTPREVDAHEYTAVEVGFPSRKIDELMPYIDGPEDAPTDTVYAYVPVDVVNRIVEEAGGIKED